jgi:hypothetical protein
MSRTAPADNNSVYQYTVLVSNTSIPGETGNPRLQLKCESAIQKTFQGYSQVLLSFPKEVNEVGHDHLTSDTIHVITFLREELHRPTQTVNTAVCGGTTRKL